MPAAQPQARMKQKAFASVVLSVRDAEDTLASTLDWVDRGLSEIYETYEVIVVDNASEDATRRVWRERSEASGSDGALICLPWAHRREQALQAGLDACVGDFVYEIAHVGDCYEGNIFERLFDKMHAGYDIASAVPDSLSLLDRLAYRFINFFSFLPFPLVTETITLSTRRALNSALKHRQRAWQRKILYRHSGYEAASVPFRPIQPVPRDPLWERVRIGIDLLFSFTHLGVAVPIFFSVFFLLVSAAIGLYALYVYFFFDSVVEGWTTLMVFLSFAFSGLFLILAFMSRHMGMILSEVHQSANYTVTRIERRTNQD